MSYTIDLQKIADELDFDLEDIEMLVEVFLESADGNLQELKDAIASDNLEGIFSNAHAIKGSAANLTLMEISELAKSIELNAREGNSFDYQGSYEKLESMISAIRV